MTAYENASSTATAVDLFGRERHEVVGGALLEKAAPSFEHGEAQGTIFGSLMEYRRRLRGNGGGSSPGGWWLATEVEIEFDTHEVYLPDVAGWRHDRHDQRPSGRPVKSLPDWVCEVLSPSTTARDLGVKRRTYHRCGVEHLWIVDPLREIVTVYHREPRGYVIAAAGTPGRRLRCAPFDAIHLDIGGMFGHEPLLEGAECVDEAAPALEVLSLETVYGDPDERS